MPCRSLAGAGPKGDVPVGAHLEAGYTLPWQPIASAWPETAGRVSGEPLPLTLPSDAGG